MSVENNDIGKTNLEGAITLSVEALRALHLANGGAVIAILTFYGNVAKDRPVCGIDGSGIACALKAFGFGLFAGLLASVLAYATQRFHATAAHKTGWICWLEILTIVAVLLSVLAFAIGAYEGGESFQPHNCPQTVVKLTPVSHPLPPDNPPAQNTAPPPVH